MDSVKLRDLLQTQLTNLASGKMEMQEKLSKAQVDISAQEKEMSKLQKELVERKAQTEDEALRKARISDELLVWPMVGTGYNYGEGYGMLIWRKEKGEGDR